MERNKALSRQGFLQGPLTMWKKEFAIMTGKLNPEDKS